MKKIHTDNPYSDLSKKLLIDCKNCSGLCCVALYFAKCEGFPTDKPAGKPCKNLMSDFRCTIHAKLLQSKMKGCLAYDCFGAGQKVTQNIYKGKNWKTTPEIVNQMFDVFLIVFQLHQMLWYLIEASTIISSKELKLELDALILQNEKMTQLCPDEIQTLDIDIYRLNVNRILKKISTSIATSSTENRKTSNFIGQNFKKANLDGKDFSMAILIAGNLEGCSLRGTNFLGADLRDTNIKNTDLRESVFLTQMQVNTAIGNHNTALPALFIYPTSWQRL